MSSRFETDTYFVNQIRSMLSDMPDFVRKYIRSIHNTTAPRTQYEYLKDIRQYLTWLQKSRDQHITLDLLANQTKDDFEDYLEFIEQYEDKDGTLRTNSRTSIKRKLSSLRRFFEYLFHSELISSDEIRKITPPKTNQKEIVCMESSEISDFLNAIEHSGQPLTKKQQDYCSQQSVRDMAIMTLMLSTGIRVSECAELDVTDVDMVRSCLHIVRKGGNESSVYFSDEASACLQAWLEQRSQIKGLSDTETALFLSSRKRRISVRTIQILVNKYAQRASIGKHITPHKLRSTFATSLYQETGDIYLVAETLGHKDVTTTKEHYAKLSDSRKQENRNKIHLFSNH